MKRLNFLIGACLVAIVPLIHSCDSDDDKKYLLLQPTALVTVCPQPDETVVFQLNDTEQLLPVNLKKLPYGKKEVRALVNYSPVEEKSNASIAHVKVNWIDSIRTKMPVAFNAADASKYGNDPLEIVKDWVTVAEDGYLTLRIRTIWGQRNIPHVLTLTYGQNHDNEMEFVLHQNANGDVAGVMGDALIAFNLNKFLSDKQTPAKITLKWNSFSGEKTAELTLNANRKPATTAVVNNFKNNNVE